MYYIFLWISVLRSMLTYSQWDLLLVNSNSTFIGMCKVLELMKVLVPQLMKNPRVWNIFLWCLLLHMSLSEKLFGLSQHLHFLFLIHTSSSFSTSPPIYASSSMSPTSLSSFTCTCCSATKICHICRRCNSLPPLLSTPIPFMAPFQPTSGIDCGPFHIPCWKKKR